MRQTRTRAAEKRGFTLIELLVVVAIIALLISILLPSLARARELSKRAACASNVKQIGVGFYAYGASNQDMFPISNHLMPDDPDAVNTTPGTTYVNYVGAYGQPCKSDLNAPVANPVHTTGETNGKQMNKATDPVPDQHMSTTRNFWLLVRNGANTAKGFICPSSDDTPNSMDNPQQYWDFGVRTTAITPAWDVIAYPAKQYGWQDCSYGYQVPYGGSASGKPSANRDNDMVLAADKGPFGAEIDGGKSTDPLIAWVPGPTLPTFGSSPDDWRKLNSPNHGGYKDGEGQVVMYSDGRAEFVMTPLAGVNKDNIYTRWPAAKPDDTNAATSRYQGSRPLYNVAVNKDLAPFSDTDTLIYP
jgi:prepilin-type N-terminal cleavage/methylation domain-containing protein